MKIDIFITDISKLKSITPDLIKIFDYLYFPNETLVERDTIIKRHFLPFMNSLKDELKIVIETGYVDMTYRDSYYCFYASKLLTYNRYCVRLSFFRNTFDDSRGLKDVNNYRDNYLGFLVLRPLHKCIGRNVISPEAKLNDNILICRANIPITCSGIKLEASGFPHASQDTETMTCAQTTIWSLLEYFGNKYSNYCPTMPSLIEKALEPYSFERLIPSPGLTYNQISVALRQFGFGPRIYSKSNNVDFNEIFTCYIESGIPLAVAMSDGNCYGHAVVCVGRKKKDRIDMLKGQNTSKLKSKNVWFWNQCIKEFVFNDDNHPNYVEGNIEHTAAYYGEESSLANMEISHIIAPLYSKIYMDASSALKISKLLIEELININDNDVIRTFLTSTRTYREYLITDSGFAENNVQILLSMPMPKFVWVTEVASYDDFIKKRVDIVIVIDATSGGRNISSSVVYIFEKGDLHIYNAQDRKLQKITANFDKVITSFSGNLK